MPSPFDVVFLFPKLFYDMAFSWVRMIVALVVSILFSWAVGITAARTRRGEKVIIPTLDILQSIPILGFFPIVLIVFVRLIPGQLGVDSAVTFLIFTSMAWNIAFSVYESVKAIPKEYLELAWLEKFSFYKRLTVLYIPSTWTKVAFNSIISWAVALFYLVSSEIFTLGSSAGQVGHGIGVDIASFASSGAWGSYAAAIATLIIVDLLTWSLILDQFARWSEKYKVSADPVQLRTNRVYRFYARLNGIFVSRLSYALSRGRRVARSLAPKTAGGEEGKDDGGRRTLLRLYAGRGHEAIDRRVSRDKNKFPKTATMAVVFPLVGLFFVTFGRGLIPLVLALPGEASYISLPSAVPFLSRIAADELQVAIALAFSFVRVWIAYAVAVSIALPAGIYVALNNKIYSVMSPILQVVASVPAPVLLPPIALVIATMPEGGEIDALIVIVIAMTWYIIFNVMEGVRTIPNELRNVSSLLKLKGIRVWKNVYIPSALPSFVTGSLAAVGGAWNALIVAEYFSIGFSQGGRSPTVVSQVPDGIGKLLDLASNSGDVTLLLLSLVSMTALIVSFDVLVWKRLYSYTTKRYAQYAER